MIELPLFAFWLTGCSRTICLLNIGTLALLVDARTEWNRLAWKAEKGRSLKRASDFRGEIVMSMWSGRTALATDSMDLALPWER